MSKNSLLMIVIGTIGGLVFSLGMCLCLINEWNLLRTGIIVAVVGGLILLLLIPVYRKDHPRKEKLKISFSTILPWIAGIAGALVMGYGMSRVMVENLTANSLVMGLILGIVGLIVCVLNYPVYAFLSAKK